MIKLYGSVLIGISVYLSIRNEINACLCVLSSGPNSMPLLNETP